MSVQTNREWAVRPGSYLPTLDVTGVCEHGQRWHQLRGIPHDLAKDATALDIIAALTEPRSCGEHECMHGKDE
jgi:hypothetical protein